jgi:hypothetical protein
MSTRTITDHAALCQRLRAVAEAHGRELCSRCGGSHTRPCSRCVKQRERILASYAEDRTLAQIAVGASLPAWRVRDILDAALAEPQPSDGELALEAELGADIVELAKRDTSTVPRDERATFLYYRNLLLEIHGWTIKSARQVLAGTSLPNQQLRKAVESALADGALESLETLCSRIGADGTYLSRALGMRAASTHRKRSKVTGEITVYGGHLQPCMPADMAARVATALGLRHDTIPGL